MSDQSCADAAAADAAPYVMTPQTTCDPSQYLVNGMSSTPDASGPSPGMWTMGPAGYDAAPPSFNGDIYGQLGIQNPNAMTFTYSSVQPPYADAAGCKAFDAQGHAAAHNCLCDNCFTQMQECDALVGCRAIAKCGWDTGCSWSAAITATNSCYPLFGGGCVTQINQYGTGSVSTGIAQQLGACGQNKGCPSQ